MGSFNLRDRGTRGQISIILIFALPTLLGAMALCVDVGNLYLNRVRIQTATDAAVLAGANYLPDYKTQATATTQQYATANGIAVSEMKVVRTLRRNRVRMSSTSTAPMTRASPT